MKSETVISPEETICYHCGENLSNNLISHQDKNFCCIGCKSVFQILSENNMCSYYAYNENPGQRFQNHPNFEYLDDPTIVAELVDYTDDENTIVTFYLSAIHCSSCIWLLENLFKINPAIYSSRVHFLKKQITISFKNQKITLKEVVLQLTEIGYEPAINLQDVVKANNVSVNKNLIFKIAVAGFSMGNVMLFSFPEYFGLSNLEKEFQSLFGWLNLAFCIPVTFYCAKEYFVSAYLSLKHKHINLDTPLALIILVLFFRTAITVIFFHGPGFADTLTGLVFLLLIGKWIKQRTYYHISFDRDYRSYFPIAVTLINNGFEKPLSINLLKVGDRLLIRNGELIPADAILMRGEARLDMSFVTGEEEPQYKILGEMIYAGGRQTGEAIEVEIIKLASQSYLTGLWNNENYKIDNRSKNFNDSIAKYFSVGVFIFAFASAAYWIYHHDSTKAWSAFTAVIIVACPCVLALSTPFTLSAILAVFDKKGFYVKNTDAVEQLAKCDAIIFDKTGTLTSSVNALTSFSGVLTEQEKTELASVLRNSAHPLSRHILKYLNRKSVYSIKNYVETVGKGLSAIVNGKLICIGNHTVLPKGINPAGLNGVHVVIANSYKGFFSIKQQWRNGLPALISKLKNHFELQVLSGDHHKDQVFLESLFPQFTTIKFEQTPIDKLNAVRVLQSEAKKVMMLGDGLNDAGALKQSDFGIAITDNVNNFTPGCDAILKGESLKFLPNFFQLSKDGLTVIKTSFAIATIYNFIGLYYAVQGTLYPLVAAVLMPISTITIVLFTTLATRYLARKNNLI